MSAAERAVILAQLGRLLDRVDEQTRQEGEPPLRSEVARQARENLDALTEDHQR